VGSGCRVEEKNSQPAPGIEPRYAQKSSLQNLMGRGHFGDRRADFRVILKKIDIGESCKD
jgi:hypothetical protein